MFTLEQIQNGLAYFIDQELASKATGLKKFMIYFLTPTIKRRVADYVHKYKHFVPDIIDAENRIDLDVLYNYSKEAIQRSGQFEFMDIIFNESDVDKLYSYIKNM